MELGCGSGTAGVSLARTGAKRVLLTDGDADAIRNCRTNLGINGISVSEHAVSRCDSQANGQEPEVQCFVMRWEEPCSLQPDVVLAADVLYDPGEKQSTIAPPALLFAWLPK